MAEIQHLLLLFSSPYSHHPFNGGSMAYIPLPTPAEMNSWDTQAISAFGIREEILMENASREALHVLLELTGSITGKRVLAFMGSGNNGGDAAAVARHLHNLGADVLLLHTKPVREYHKTTGYHFKLARNIGTPHALLTPKNASRLLRAEQPDIIIDGLLGTGLRGPLSSDKASIIEHINSLGKKSFRACFGYPVRFKRNVRYR
jgi:ADP-dependent NAD(P)H-hydrate dehydratase / NAD(P)H-hydrate epimerase